jgi:hypothetical protein
MPSLEALNKTLQPYDELQKRIDCVLEPQRRFEEQFEKLLAPQRLLEKQMEAWLAPQRRLEKQVEKLLAPQRRLDEHIARLLEPQRRLEERMLDWLRPHNLFQDKINRLLEPHLGLQKQVARLLKSVGEDLDAAVAGGFVSDGGATAPEPAAVDVAQVAECLEQVSSASSSLADFLQRLENWLPRLSTAARALVLHLCLPFIVSIAAAMCMPLLEEWWKELESTNTRNAKKELISRAAEAYSSEGLKGFRFVSATVLHVREGSSIKSPVVSELYLGKVVRVVSRRNRWILVEYMDDHADELAQGWVFGRYLLKLRP